MNNKATQKKAKATKAKLGKEFKQVKRKQQSQSRAKAKKPKPKVAKKPVGHFVQ